MEDQGGPGARLLAVAGTFVDPRGRSRVAAEHDSVLADAFGRHCRKYRTEPETGRRRYAILQAEDEIAAIGIVVGAAWNGARAFTATSGPGISLMQEFLGLAYFAEIPAVIFDVQRGGPSTGMPTRTQQSDLLACAYASHGDTKHVMLFPEDPTECFEFAAQAFDLADRLQTPVFLMTDLDIGMNTRLCDPLQWDDKRVHDRGKVVTREELEAGKEFGRYLDVDGDGIPFRTLPGTHPSRGAYFTRGTTKDRYARYSEAGPDYVDNMQRLARKFDTAKALVPKPLLRPADKPARFGAIHYGSTSAPMNEKIVNFVCELSGVQLATGTAAHPIGGVDTVSGIDLDSFSRMCGGFRYVEGGPFQAPEDVIVDERYARQRNLHAGDTLQMMNRTWRISGIVEPGKLARIFVPLRVLQDLTGNTGKLSVVYVKLNDSSNTPQFVASLKERLKDYQIYSMDDFISLISVDNLPGLRLFIGVVIGVSVVVGFLVVFL